jgi:hypothetical protein
VYFDNPESGGNPSNGSPQPSGGSPVPSGDNSPNPNKPHGDNLEKINIKKRLRTDDESDAINPSKRLRTDDKSLDELNPSKRLRSSSDSDSDKSNFNSPSPIRPSSEKLREIDEALRLKHEENKKNLLLKYEFDPRDSGFKQIKVECVKLKGDDP